MRVISYPCWALNDLGIIVHWNLPKNVNSQIGLKLEVVSHQENNSGEYEYINHGVPPHPII